MLKTPEIFYRDPVLDILFETNTDARVLEEGCVEIGHFSLDLLIWGQNAPKFYMGYPEFAGDLNCYGVCDTPQQFLDRFRDVLSADPRTFVVGFTHVAKNPGNKGQGDGWRWHKWGPYIGTGTPSYEYLDDEDGFEAGVYCYHILQTAGPEWKP